MRILQISRVPPGAGGDGSSATFTTLRAICEAGHEVTYAYLHEGRSPPAAEAADALLSRCGGRLRIVPLSARMRCIGRPLRLVRTMLSAGWERGLCPCLRDARRPRELALKAWRLGCCVLTPSPHLLRQIQQLLSQSHYDVVQFDFPTMLRVGSRLISPRPRVFVAYEIQTTIAEQAYPQDRRYGETLFRRELDELRRYDAVVAFSPEDARLLETRFGVEHAYYSPLAVDCSRLREPAPLSQGGVRFSFLGGHRHAPNVDGVKWLCGEIVPRLRAAFPGMQLQVIGSYPPAFVRTWSAPDIVFTGFVDDFTNLLAGSIFLCPIRLASGMRIKILDAILRGAPVISTDVGARGLGMTEGVHYLVADSAEEFCRQARRLVENDRLREDLCRKAQEHVQAVFSPAAVARRRVEVLQEAIASRVGFRRERLRGDESTALRTKFV